MTPEASRFHSRLQSAPARLAAALCAALLPLCLAAQDNKAGECIANENEVGETCLPEAAPGAPAVGPETTLDWADTRQVPRELRDDSCLNCGGRYMDPLADVDQSIPPEESEIQASATRSELQGNIIRLEGGVAVNQGYRQLNGDSAQIDRVTRSGFLTGNIVIREPGVLLLGDRAEVYSRTGEASIENSAFVLHEQHLRGSSDILQRSEDGILHAHGGQLTFCPPEESDWQIRAREIELNLDEGLGVARGARIDLGRVPIFYSPWLQFPLDDRRRTGFLWPDIGSDSRGGLDIAAPVYFNIRPNWDAIYAPRFIQERGLNHEVQLRHLNRYIGAWELGGAWMKDDDRYEEDFPDERNHNRWLVVARHDALFDQRWRSKVDYSKASDANYMKDLETTSIDAKRKTALLQLATLDYLGDNWLLEAEVQQFQSLADDIRDDYKKLPQLSARYWPDGETFSIDPIFFTQYSNFDTDNELRVTGQRLYAEAGATYPMRWIYGFLQPTAKFRQLNYELDDHPLFLDNQPSAGVPLFSVDGGLVFDRQTSVSGRSLTQTLEPRIYYLYSEFEDQSGQPDFDSAELTFSYNQLFRETRFSGHDRLDDANQVSFGLTTRYINNEDGREQFSATIGQIFYFEDYQVRLNPLDPALDNNRSELAGQFNFDPNDRTNFRGSLIWDPNGNQMNSGNVQASYTWDEQKIVNLGYTFRRPIETLIQQPNVEQVHFSTYMPLGRRWAAFAAINYSLEASTSVEDMIGVEYDSCCWKVRLLHLRYYDNVPGQLPGFDNPDLQREESTQIQIMLKGMGGFGDRATRIMENMIRGFRDFEY
jgi:LPS-assembly protein